MNAVVNCRRVSVSFLSAAVAVSPTLRQGVQDSLPFAPFEAELIDNCTARF